VAGENNLNSSVGMDTTSFKTGVSDLNAQIRSIETGFRASAAVMGDWSSTSNGLTERTSSLSEKLDLQKQKLNTLHTEYDLLTHAEGDNTKAIESVANQMFSAEKAITSTESDLKKYDTQLKEVDETSKKIDFSSLKDGFAKVGSGAVSGLKAAGTAIVGMGAAVAGATVGLGAMVTKASDSANSLTELSQQTGLSTDKLQEMQYVGGALDVSLDTMTGAHTRLIKAMTSAEKSTSTQAAAFKALGVATQDSNGHLLDSNTVFNNAMGALGGVQNATERDSLSLQLFGKSALALNPLITTGTAGLAAMSAEADKNGAVMSSAAV
jgi:hypothetical protein